MISGNGTYYDRARSDSAPFEVLFHDLNLRRACWQWQARDLSEPYRVLACDMWRHGYSPDAPETPRLAVFSQQLADLLDEQGVERAAIAGFSMVGMICQRFAMDHLNRTNALAILHLLHARSVDAQAGVKAHVALAREEGLEVISVWRVAVT